VWAKKASASELLMKRRKGIGDIKTRGSRYSWEEPGGYPFTAQVVSGVKVARAWSGLRYGTWEPALRYCGQRNELRAHWSREREALVVEAMRARVAMRGAGADCPVVAVKPGNAGGAKGAGRPGSLDGQPRCCGRSR
jgi:hypothetical protein